MPDIQGMQAYAPGVDEEITDKTDMSEEEYIGYYGMDKNGNPVNSPEGPFVPDATDDAIRKLAQQYGVSLNNETKDYLLQTYLQNKSADYALGLSKEYDSTKYQRAVEDMKKAGLNPFLAMQSLGSSSGLSSGSSITSGSITSQRNTKTQANTNIATQIMQVLGIVAAAVIYAMAA